MALDQKVTLIFDYDLTLTENWQQVPYIEKHFDKLQKEYNGKIININNKTVEIKLKKPSDYFKLSDLWAEPHNGVGYVMQMLYDAKKGIFDDFNEKTLKEYGAKVKLSPGLPEFFKALRDRWKDKCKIDFFIVSVGLIPLIEGSAIAQSGQINDIFATNLFELDNFWNKINSKRFDSIRDVVSPFNKTAYAIEIAKGSRRNLNRIMPHRDYAVDYRNIVVFGDGSSDISQFAYLRRKGSRIIGVYKNNSVEAYDKIRTNKLIQDRCNAILPRNYKVGSNLWNYVNRIIESITNRNCDFDPELIDMYRKRKIRSKEVMDLVQKHVGNCLYCDQLTDLKIIPPDTE